MNMASSKLHQGQPVLSLGEVQGIYISSPEARGSKLLHGLYGTFVRDETENPRGRDTDAGGRTGRT